MKTECYGQRVVFSPDGRILATAYPAGSYTEDRRGTLIDVATGQRIQSIGHDEWAHAIAFSPDGKLIAVGGGDDKVSLWDTSPLKIAAFFKKDEFETTAEYTERVKGVKMPYSTKITPGRYDADRGGFEIEIQGIKAFVPVKRDKAKEIAANKDNVFISGNLVYAGNNSLELIDAELLFDK